VTLGLSGGRVLTQDRQLSAGQTLQLTTDGHKPYLSAVEDAFGADVDYAMLQKLYGSNPEETRYTPAKIIGIRSEVIRGNPDLDYVSTSYVER